MKYFSNLIFYFQDSQNQTEQVDKTHSKCKT